MTSSDSTRPPSSKRGAPSRKGGPPSTNGGAPSSANGGAPSSQTVPPVAKRGLLTPEEAAALLAVPTSRMKRMRIKGEGPNYIAFGRVIRYHPQDIRVWINANRHIHR